MNGCSYKPLCVDSTEEVAVCLKLKPAGCSKIRAIRTVTTTAVGCTRVVTYSALDATYNPLTGYTMADEVPCGTGENLPFDCGTSSTTVNVTQRASIISCSPDNEQVLSIYNTAVVPPVLLSRTLVSTGADYTGQVIDCNASNITHVVGCAPNGDRILSRYSTQFSALVLLNQFNLETGAPYSGDVNGCATGGSNSVDSFINAYQIAAGVTSQDVTPFAIQPTAHSLEINGVEYRNPDVTFMVAGSVLSWIWNGSFPLDPTDNIVLRAHVSN